MFDAKKNIKKFASKQSNRSSYGKVARRVNKQGYRR